MDTQRLLSRLRSDAIDPPTPEPQRTQYGIYLPAPIDRWLGTRRHWVERDQAIRFPSMLRATIAAVQALDLDPAAFTVEAL